MTDKFQPLRQALAALKLSGPVSTSAAKWNAASDALDVELVAELLAERDALVATAAEPEAMGDEPELPEAADQLAQADGFNVIGTVGVFTADQLRTYAQQYAQWQSTRLRGGVPEGWQFRVLSPGSITVQTESGYSCTLWKSGHGGVEALAYQMADMLRKSLTAAPQAPALDAASDPISQKWCWWLGDSETFHIADTESEAHGEAQCRIDDDCEQGGTHRYNVARVQHPMDSLGMDWIAEHVADSIEQNVCCWCDDNTGAEEPSIMLDAEDKKALGQMVAGFLREKAGVDWWTSDKTTVTEHDYVAGRNDNPALAAMSAQGGGK